MAMEFSKEQIERAAACKSVAELRELAKSEGIELTDDEAETYFAELNSVRVSDDELDAVAGGKRDTRRPNKPCSCKGKK
ncbi:MAG: hypothetical protein IJ668_00325 [Selenomonadaceae bacterium]|nr:hypothetical protein [Selenomonadaceae bacterium]